VEVSVFDRCVVLQGRVPSCYMKQVAQAIASEIAGDRQLRNEVSVGA
jgi:osmotically-inducible protein OsmY